MPLIGAAFVIGAIAKPISDMIKADKYDTQAAELRMDAADKIGKATADSIELEKSLDRSCKKAADRKKSIVENIFPRFLDVYSKICEINFDMDERALAKEFSTADLSIIQKDFISISELPCHSMTDNQLLSNALVEGFKGYLLGGSVILSAITGSTRKDSEIALHDAEEFEKSARIYKNNVEKSKTAYEAIIWQIEKLSDLLAKLNALMLRSCRYSDKLITEKGYNSENYSDKDLEYLTICINIAVALKECVLTPVFNKDNELTKAAMELIKTSEQCTYQFSEALKNI